MSDYLTDYYFFLGGAAHFEYVKGTVGVRETLTAGKQRGGNQRKGEKEADIGQASRHGLFSLFVFSSRSKDPNEQHFPAGSRVWPIRMQGWSFHFRLWVCVGRNYEAIEQP